MEIVVCICNRQKEKRKEKKKTKNWSRTKKCILALRIYIRTAGIAGHEKKKEKNLKGVCY